MKLEELSHIEFLTPSPAFRAVRVSSVFCLSDTTRSVLFSLSGAAISIGCPVQFQSVADSYLPGSSVLQVTSDFSHGFSSQTFETVPGSVRTEKKRLPRRSQRSGCLAN